MSEPVDDRVIVAHAENDSVTVVDTEYDAVAQNVMLGVPEPDSVLFGDTEPEKVAD